MKITISEKGFLSIERAGKMKEQICPHTYTDDDNWLYCGDWCPLFQEPMFEDNDRSRPWTVQICDAVYSGKAEDFEDQRDNRETGDKQK